MCFSQGTCFASKYAGFKKMCLSCYTHLYETGETLNTWYTHHSPAAGCSQVCSVCCHRDKCQAKSPSTARRKPGWRSRWGVGWLPGLEMGTRCLGAEMGGCEESSFKEREVQSRQTLSSLVYCKQSILFRRLLCVSVHWECQNTGNPPVVISQW